ncbi:MAG TPA: YihY/virulence factor BrkB family protein [Chloroflexota bacterium]
MSKAVIKAASRRSVLSAIHVPGPVADFGRAAALFWRDNGPGMAGTIAFFGFLSVIPLVLLFLAITGDLLQGRVSDTDIRKLFHNVTPGLSQQQFLRTYWHPIQHTKVANTILGAVSLLLGTLGLHDSVDWAVNRLWRSPTTRSFWIAKLRGIAVIVWVTIFAVLSLVLTAAWTVLLSTAHAGGLLSQGWIALVPSLILDTALFTALYKLTPMVEVDLEPALLAGFVGALLWELSKIAFGYWVLEVSSYNRVYGPLAASVIVMLWLWISAMLFLFGAALSVVVQQRHRARVAGEVPVRHEHA